MATITLSAEKDPMGAAISDYFNHHRADRLRVFSSQFEEDEIPVKELFRSIQSMPVLERTALRHGYGKNIRCRSRKRLPRIGTSRNGKRSLRRLTSLRFPTQGNQDNAASKIPA